MGKLCINASAPAAPRQDEEREPVFVAIFRWTIPYFIYESNLTRLKVSRMMVPGDTFETTSTSTALIVSAAVGFVLIVVLATVLLSPYRFHGTERVRRNRLKDFTLGRAASLSA